VSNPCVPFEFKKEEERERGRERELTFRLFFCLLVYWIDLRGDQDATDDEIKKAYKKAVSILERLFEPGGKRARGERNVVEGGRKEGSHSPCSRLTFLLLALV